MIALLAGVALALPVVAFDRVDLVSEDNPGWLADELPHADVRFETTAARWAEQLEVVTSFPRAGFDVGLSVRAQSLQWERPLVPGIGLHGATALITRVGLPVGGRVGLAVRQGPVRIGVSLVLASDASWARPEFDTWRWLPSVGIGVGRSGEPEPEAPWI